MAPAGNTEHAQYGCTIDDPYLTCLLPFALLLIASYT